MVAGVEQFQQMLVQNQEKLEEMGKKEKPSEERTFQVNSSFKGYTGKRY